MALGPAPNASVHDDRRRQICDLPWGAPALELGAGRREDGLAVPDRGFRVLETNISRRSLVLPRHHTRLAGLAGRAACVVTDGERFPSGANLFDAVLIVAGLHHMQDPHRCVKQMFRWARLGGFAVIGVEPDRWYLRVFRSPGMRVEWTLAHMGIGRHRLGRLGRPRSVSEATACGFAREGLVALVKRSDGSVVGVSLVWFLFGLLCHVSQVRAGLS